MCACFADKLLRAGQSLIVTNSNARRLKFSCLYSSHIHTPSSPQSNKSSSTNGLRYTSMTFSWLLWARDKHWHHDELLFHVDPWWKIVHTKSHRPSAMTTAHLTKRIHAIHIQTETYVSHIQFKFRVLFFSTATHQRGVSTSSLACVPLCAIAST